jgi:hypothetical protein
MGASSLGHKYSYYLGSWELGVGSWELGVGSEELLYHRKEIVAVFMPPSDS